MLLQEQDRTAEPADVLARAGWELKPEGACRGEVCVPLGGAATLDEVAAILGMATVVDDASGRTALGPASIGGRALTTVEAPDLELPLVQSDGVWRLASQRGRRTVMVAWAPW